MQGEPRRAGHAETDHGENLGGITEMPLSAGARRTGKDLTGGPGSSVERAAHWSDAAWERRVRQRCWAAERAQGEEGVAAE